MSNFKLKPWNRGISNEELLADLRRVAELLGRKTVRYEEYPSYGRCASKIFEKRFGSWNKALMAAGLEISSRQDITVEELYENLERVWRSLGRQPRREEIRKPLSLFSGNTYENRFGGWRKALESFVAYANGDTNIKIAARSEPPTRNNPRFPDLRMRWHVLNRDSFRCCSCGRSPALERGIILHIDHIIPWSQSGPTQIENLQTLCEQCNLGKSDATPSE